MNNFRWMLLLLVTLFVSACSDGLQGQRVYSAGAASNGEPVLGAALPPSEVANSVASGPTTREEAFRLLEQTTYGARLEDIETAAALGPNGWIDRQMTTPVTWMLTEMGRANSDRWNEHVNVWWRQAIKAEDQLRQRVAFALSEIFVVSGTDSLGGEQEGLANYYDILLRNAFGNYRTLLEEVTLNPVMGEYLSMKGNHKPDPEQNIRPDENYARELLQLFSIGLEQLNPDGTPVPGPDGVAVPTYDQAVVEGFAHVFTGWHFANAEKFRWAKNEDYLSPMRAFEDFHDTGEKQLLRGFRAPAGQTAAQDMTTALDNVFNHPNVGPFIVKQLIKRLVTSNPSPGYVRDVAAVFDRNAAGERGNLGSTIKAILMHREAREGHIERPETFGKVKEPLLRVTQLWRAFEPERIPAGFNYAWAANELAQAPLVSPSVFNFFRPDFAPPGEIADAGLVAPEMEILDETSMITLTGRLLAGSIWSNNYKADLNGDYIAIDITREMQLEPDRDALLDHLDLLLLGGRMSDGLRTEVDKLMDARTYNDAASLRVAEAIFLILSSPDAAIQH